METKPYRLQSPEDIAKDYGGNKQKIAQAMQMGIVDPTAGVLAGMFIDRMRSAQTQEAAPPPTVAQQVMGGTPAPLNPPSPTGGVGAPSMAPPPMGAPAPAPMPDMGAMQAPMPAPQGAPMGMAEGGMVPPYMAGGGLSELPVPDGMFDEDRNGGYAGGGVVAFAGGGPTSPMEWGDYFENLAVQSIPNVRVTSRQRSVEANRKVGGAPNSYHLTGAARDFVPPPGMSLTQLGDSLRSIYGPGVDVIYNTKGHYDHVHVEPGGTKGRGGRAAAGAGVSPNGGLGGTVPSMASMGSLANEIPAAYADAEKYYNANIPERTNEGINLLTAEARKTLDPEDRKKQADKDKWMTLAEIGFNMAASNSPYLLQAAGAAAAAALPGAKAARKEREDNKKQAIRDLAAAEDITYKQSLDKANFLRDFAKDRLDIRDKDLSRNMQYVLQQMGEAGALQRAEIGKSATLGAAQIQADSYGNVADKQLQQLDRQARIQAPEIGYKLAQLDPAFQKATRSGNTAEARKILDSYILQAYNSSISPGSSSGGQSDVVDVAWPK